MITPELFDYVMILYQAYEDSLKSAYYDAHKNLSTYVPYLKTLFLTTNVYAELEDINCNVVQVDLTDCCYCIIPFQVSLELWAALIIDCNAERIFYFDPTLTNNYLAPEDLEERLTRYEVNVNNKILRPKNLVPEGENWMCDTYLEAKLFHEKPQNGYDMGVFLLSAIPLIALNCPVIFSSTDLQQFRISLCASILRPEI